jgi:DNA-binding transcriptional regulator/RsmH inhibitor MraZ
VTPLDENLFIKLVNDIEASDVLNEEDRDLLRKLARKAAEVESDVEN